MKNQFSLFIFFVVLINQYFSQTVTIGNQVWMTKNLDVSTFRNGDPIPEAKTNEDWIKAGKKGKPAWCYFDNRRINDDPENGANYGKLYNWYAVNDSRGLAPVGFHIPSDDEWSILVNYLGGREVAGTKMKSKTGWQNSGNETNESDFSGLPGSSRGPDGTFDYFGHLGFWWSSTEGDTGGAWGRRLSSGWVPLSGDGQSVSRLEFVIGAGFSVRCVKD
jgi:uncharacterized protein (TIGR02145 family)